MSESRLVYLASPYSHPLFKVRKARFRAVCDAAARLMSTGAMVFSPIAHTHSIALAGALPTGFEYWAAFDRRMIVACDEVVVLQIDGWETSKGVQAEIRIAGELGKPIRYLGDGGGA